MSFLSKIARWLIAHKSLTSDIIVVMILLLLSMGFLHSVRHRDSSPAPVRTAQP